MERREEGNKISQIPNPNYSGERDGAAAGGQVGGVQMFDGFEVVPEGRDEGVCDSLRLVVTRSFWP